MEQTRYLSDELEVLLAEWLVYAAINHYQKYTYPEYRSDDQDEKMGQKEMFETIPFMTEYDSSLSYSAYLFETVGISFNGSNGSCKYEQVRETIRANINGFQGSFIDFFGAAETKSEEDRFKIEPGCQPLFDRFLAEGYCKYSEGHFYWTPKMRPVLETFGYWESKLHPTKDERLMSSLEPDLIEKLTHFANTNQFIMAVKTLKDAKQLDLRTAKLFIEDYMFPEQCGRQKEPWLIRWFGPAPNRGSS